MPVEVMLLVLLGALLHASWNAMVRSSQDKLLDTVLIVTGAGIVALAGLPFMAMPAPASWPYLAASVLVHVGYFALVAMAYHDGELSFAYPLMRGTAPMFSAIAAALLLDESPSLNGWLGILFICGGVLLLAFDALRTRTFSGKAASYAFGNAAIIVIYTLIDGMGARLSGAAFSYTAWMLMLTAIPMLAACRMKLRPAVFGYLSANWRKALLGGALSLGAYGLALWAMTRAPIALVAALRETSVVFALLIAALFMRERITRLRYGAVAVVLAGVVAMRLG